MATVVEFLSVATFDDIMYMLRSMSKSRVSLPEVQKITSILVGAEYLRSIGEYGHLSLNAGKPRLLEVDEGRREEESTLRLSLATAYQFADAEFLKLVEESRNAN